MISACGGGCYADYINLVRAYLRLFLVNSNSAITALVWVRSRLS